MLVVFSIIQLPSAVKLLKVIQSEYSYYLVTLIWRIMICRMLDEILATRLMVKRTMKDHKENAVRLCSFISSNTSSPTSSLTRFPFRHLLHFPHSLHFDPVISFSITLMSSLLTIPSIPHYPSSLPLSSYSPLRLGIFPFPQTFLPPESLLHSSFTCFPSSLDSSFVSLCSRG